MTLKLSDEDLAYLKGCGVVTPDEIRQVKYAARTATYLYGGKKIPPKQACEMLDRKTFLSGIARAAFHMTASRHYDGRPFFDGKEHITLPEGKVQFDCSKMWKEMFSQE